MVLLQEDEPTLSRAQMRLLSNIRKWIVSGDTCADKARDFIGKGRLGREQQGQGTQEDCSARWFAVSGFMVMGLVSALSLAKHSDSGSFLAVQSSLSQDGCQRGGFWEVVGRVVLPFDHSWALPVGGGLLVPCSLPGPPVIKQFMQMAIWLDGAWPGWAVSVIVPPPTVIPSLSPLTDIRLSEYLLLKSNSQGHLAFPGPDKPHFYFME